MRLYGPGVFGKLLKKAPQVSGQPETIYVVDDDAAVLKALRRLLRSAGFEVIPFEDARSFLEHVKNHVIAVAIIDVCMPELNGLEAQRLLHDIAPATDDIDPARRNRRPSARTPEFRSKYLWFGARVRHGFRWDRRNCRRGVFS